jgi:CHASE3 domain sensor protein
MDKKLIVTIICSVLPLCLVAFIASRQNNQLTKKNTQQVLITQVDELVEGVLLRLSQAQSAERGFVITGKDELLAPALEAPAEIEKNLRRLNRLVADDPKQVENVKRLEPLVQQRLNFIASVVISRKQRGFDTAVKLLSEGKADELSKEIRSLCDEILAGEQASANTAMGKDESTEKLEDERLLLLAAFLGIFMISSNVVFSRFN